MKPQEVCHLFAVEDYGRNGGRKAGNVFSDEHTRSLYSYGHHFPIATHTGNQVIPILFNAATCSISTSKHQGYARQALRHLESMEVNDPRATRPQAHAENVRHLLAKAAFHLESAAAPRIREATRAANVSTAKNYATKAEHYRTAFKVPLSALTKEARANRAAVLAITPESYADALDKLKTARAAADKRREKARQAQQAVWVKREAEQEERNQETRAAWLDGTGDRYPHEHHSAPARLRLKGNAVETSQGARVHVRAAARLWPLAQRARKNGTTYSPEPPHKVGPYTLDTVSPEGVKIGCHFIPFEEMERLAPAVLAAAATAPAEEEATA